MKKLYVAIRQMDLTTVKVLLENKPELIFSTAKQPPKNDDGQSPLQVALKTGSFEIAEYLLDFGADVNFIEEESCNEWKAPVIHDAIRASVLNARFTRSWDKVNWELCNTEVQADTAFNLLKRMFGLGADINAHDSYGNSCLGRAILDARQVLPSYNYKENKLMDDRLLNEELQKDLERIFDLLLQQGADIYEIDQRFGKPLCEFYEKEPVAQFLAKKDMCDKISLI